MNASDAFVEFVTRTLLPDKARRFATLASSEKGKQKLLDGLCHEFEPAIRDSAIRERDYSRFWDEPVFAYHPRLGFGVEFSHLRDAYNELSLDDGWLVVLQDATTGIHRPEARWDDEKLLSG